MGTDLGAAGLGLAEVGWVVGWAEEVMEGKEEGGGEEEGRVERAGGEKGGAMAEMVGVVMVEEGEKAARLQGIKSDVFD